MGIISHLTDTDLYKLTMMQAVLNRHPFAMVKYGFKCRDKKGMPYADISEKSLFLSRINHEINNLCSLGFNEEELSYLSTFPFFKDDFINFLKTFRLKRHHVVASLDSDGKLDIKINGPWFATILFEVPILAIVSELYCEMSSLYTPDAQKEGRKRLGEKIDYLATLLNRGELSNFAFVDMGTRRRYSFQWQNFVINELIAHCQPMFAGTSNIYISMKTGIQCIGTMAHEWLQAHQQLESELKDFQKAALEIWIKEYHGQLGIALSDVVGMDAFLIDFNLYFSTLYNGVRHDSGDPFEWCRKLINHYNALGIEPKTKTAVFSDGLDFKVAVDLYQRFQKDINTFFGIGTFLTNDMGVPAPQIVIKMVACNGAPVAKISDSLGKFTCEDKSFEAELKSVFYIKENHNA